MNIRLKLNIEGKSLSQADQLAIAAFLSLKQKERDKTILELMDLRNNADAINYPSYSAKMVNDSILIEDIRDPQKLYRELTDLGYNISSSSITFPNKYHSKENN